MTENPELGVLLGALDTDKETRAALKAAADKKIAWLTMTGDSLEFIFEDGTKLTILDEDHNCCERRYMSTDDVLEHFAGARFRGVEVRDVDDLRLDRDVYDVHDMQFLIVSTDQGSFTVATHNEHNGYYGGFRIVAKSE